MDIKSKMRSKILQSEVLMHLHDFITKPYYKYLISDKKLNNKRFKKRMGRDMDVKNPEKYNDKLQWLKLYWYDPIATKCADKYEVRDYVKEKIGEQYLNELLGVYESVDEIDLDELPKSFVLKGTHGSGFNIICKDKAEMNWKKEFIRMKRWLRQNFYWRSREWVYKDIKPRIICEKYIEEVKTGELRDYKIFCFNGKAKLIQVDFARFTNHKRNIYDLDWNLLDASIHFQSDPDTIIDKPENLSEMLALSEVLSEDFPHVRVDFYNVDGQIIFGELTFFHGSGTEKVSPLEFEKKMGSYLELPEKTITK